MGLFVFLHRKDEGEAWLSCHPPGNILKSVAFPLEEKKAIPEESFLLSPGQESLHSIHGMRQKQNSSILFLRHISELAFHATLLPKASSLDLL